MIELDRRALLAGAGTLAVAGMAGPAWAQDRPFGYAVVGLGDYATKQIMPRFKDCRRARLTGLVSGDPAKARRYAAEYGVPERSVYSYATFDRIRDNPDIDAVYIILPNGLHAEYVIRAAKAGKHVMCEKPMANTVAECEAMIAACRAAGRKLMIGYRCRFEAHNLHAIRLLREGAAGRIRFVATEHGGVQRDPSRWRLKKALAGGGSLADIGIYGLQATRYLTGEEPTSVTARSSTDRSDPRFHEVEDLIQWTLTFPSGVMASSMSSYSSQHNRMRVTGDKGLVELDPGTSYQGITLRTGSTTDLKTVEPPPGPGPNMWAGQLDHLAECVAAGREPIVSGEEGLRDMRIIAAIYRSAANGGQTIRL